MSKFTIILVVLLLKNLLVFGQEGCFVISGVKVFSAGKFLSDVDVLVEDGVLKAIGAISDNSLPSFSV